MEALLSRIMFPGEVCKEPKLLFILSAVRKTGFALAIFISLTVYEFTGDGPGSFAVLDTILGIFNAKNIYNTYHQEKRTYIKAFYFVDAKIDKDKESEKSNTAMALAKRLQAKELIAMRLYQKADKKMMQRKEEAEGLVYTLGLSTMVVCIASLIIVRFI